MPTYPQGVTTYIPNPNGAFGLGDAPPGVDGGDNWQLTKLRGLVEWTQDFATYTNSTTSSATATILSTQSYIQMGTQPLEFAWGATLSNNTAGDGASLGLFDFSLSATPLATVTGISGAINELVSVSREFVYSGFAPGSFHIIQLGLWAVTGGTATVNGTFFDTWLKVREI